MRRMKSKLVFLSILLVIGFSDESKDPKVYYYGMEESERLLQACSEHQACSVLVQRYWRRDALSRLCRCDRRVGCPSGGERDSRTVEMNNRAHFKFCQDTTQMKQCSYGDIALRLNTTHQNHDPDVFAALHHQQTLEPPEVILYCRCPEPFYWQLNTTEGYISNFTCQKLNSSKTGEYCGNVSGNLYSLYQKGLCPPKHMCVHNSGLTDSNMTELLYTGPGRKAYCQRISLNESSEEYIT